MGSAYAYAYDTKAGRRWEARYRKPDGKTARKGGFLRKRDAEAYIAEVEVSKSAGTYIAPSDAHATVAALGVDWLVAHEAAVKPSTYHSDESAWRIHVEPKWGARRVGSIRHTEVAAWISELAATKSPTTVKRCHGVLASILDGAVRDRRISANPAREVKTPKKSRSRSRISATSRWSVWRRHPAIPMSSASLRIRACAGVRSPGSESGMSISSGAGC